MIIINIIIHEKGDVEILSDISLIKYSDIKIKEQILKQVNCPYLSNKDLMSNLFLYSFILLFIDNTYHCSFYKKEHHLI